MAKTDTTFVDDRQRGVGHMAIVDLLGIVYAHENIAIFLDYGNVVFYACCKKTFGIVVWFKVRAFETGIAWHVMTGANVRDSLAATVRKGGIADVVGMHVIKVHAHSRNAAQRVPFGDVFRIRLFAAAGRLDREFASSLHVCI